MNQLKWIETRVKDDKRLRRQVDELLHRYFRLPLLIQQAEEIINGGPEISLRSSLTVNYAASESMSHPHRLKEQQHYDQMIVEAQRELVVLKNELNKMNSIRTYLADDELTVWDYKYKRRRRKDIHVRDELGWGNDRYYNALDGLRGQIADTFRLWGKKSG